MPSSTPSISDEPIVSPHRISIGRGGRGNMIAPEEIKDELKKASTNDEHDALAEHNRRRSSSWSLHSGNSGSSKTEVIKDFFRRGSVQSKRKKGTSQDEILEGKEEDDEEKI